MRCRKNGEFFPKLIQVIGAYLFNAAYQQVGVRDVLWSYFLGASWQSSLYNLTCYQHLIQR